jgi:hypothetical protein
VSSWRVAIILSYPETAQILALRDNKGDNILRLSFGLHGRMDVAPSTADYFA